MSDDSKFDIWMRDPYRWESEDGPYVGYALHYADQTISDVTQTLLLTGYWEVAIVTAGKQPFVKDAEGRWQKAEELYMIAQCLQPLTAPPGAPKSLAELFQQQHHE
jgi:hypothetical protein